MKKQLTIEDLKAGLCSVIFGAARYGSSKAALKAELHKENWRWLPEFDAAYEAGASDLKSIRATRDRLKV
jgi:hypothetical protein